MLPLHVFSALSYHCSRYSGHLRGCHGRLVALCAIVCLQPWAAVIVAVTVASYVPLTVIITERRGEVRKRMNALDNAREARATDMLLNWEVSDTLTSYMISAHM